MERSISDKFISQKFNYNSEENVSIGELIIDVAGERIQHWF